MRCADCSKFVAFDDGTEPECDDAEVDDEGHVTGSVRIVLTCAECGTELKEASFDLDVDLSGEVAEHRAAARKAERDKAEAEAPDDAERSPEPEDDEDDGEHTLEVEVECNELTTRTEGKGRGTKTFYGFGATVTVKCACGFTAEAEVSDDVQASSMDEM